MNFIIDRSKWRCGGDHVHKNQKGIGATYLLNKEGFMCCLGQVAKQEGFSQEDILNKHEPKNLNPIKDSITINKDGGNSDLANKAININDDFDMSLPERESRLKKIFNSYGHTIKFTGKSVKD